MTERQLNDSEIIKALDCCKYDDCNNCPNVSDNCHANLVDYVLDLIDRQKEEIERLKYCNSVNISSIGTLHERLKEAKAEAIKEFAERLCEDRLSNDPVVIAVKVELKEMVGDSDE